MTNKKPDLAVDRHGDSLIAARAALERRVGMGTALSAAAHATGTKGKNG